MENSIVIFMIKGEVGNKQKHFSYSASQITSSLELPVS